MLGNKTRTYDGLIRTMENDIESRFPNIAKHIDSIHVEKGKLNPLSADIKAAGIYANVDSNLCSKEAIPDGFSAKPLIRKVVSDSTSRFIETSMNNLVKSGYSEEDARKKVTDSLIPLMGYDRATKQYVLTCVAPDKNGKVTDSLLEQTSIPMWNIAFSTKVFKQPFTTSFAKNLVSIESFSNPWADMIAMYKESFEGYGKVSTAARGNVKQNNSNPVTNEASQILEEVYNLSVDYESDIVEDIKANQPGNFITPIIKADREKYASMILDRMHDALIYYGSREAGIDGLIDVADVELYAGTPLYDIYIGNSPTAGHDIVAAMNKLIGSYLRENHYMPTEVKINVSEFTFEALTQAMYSDTYDPSSPIKILNGNFKARNELDGGLVQCAYTITADTMCNPNTPFNPSSSDMTFITAPRYRDHFTGEQDSTIIAPELLKSYMVPALWQRSGLLYTMYRRIGGIIAPIEGTVKVIEGLGFQG